MFTGNNHLLEQDPIYVKMPGYVSLSITAAQRWTYSLATSDKYALRYFQNPPPTDGSNRIAAVLYDYSTVESPIRLSIDVGDNTRKVSFYCFDQQSAVARTQRIEIIDPTSLEVLETYTPTGFQNGVYFVFEIRGKVEVKISRVTGSNAVISGIFFDPLDIPTEVFDPLDIPTEVKEVFGNTLKIYPNPFMDTLRIVGAEGCKLQIVDARGAVVYAQKRNVTDEMLNMEHLPSGVYLFCFEKARALKIVKIMKN
jgi:hypothetical protein